MAEDAPAKTISPDVYRDTLVMAYAIVTVMRGMPLEEMLAAIEHSEALGPILEPTLFLQRGKALSEDKQVVAILARARVQLDRLPWPAEVQR